MGVNGVIGGDAQGPENFVQHHGQHPAQHPPGKLSVEVEHFGQPGSGGCSQAVSQPQQDGALQEAGNGDRNGRAIDAHDGEAKLAEDQGIGENGVQAEGADADDHGQANVAHTAQHKGIAKCDRGE